MNITALIVDDEPAARELLRHLLLRHKYVETIGEAAGVDEAWNLIVQKQPNLVFLDMELPGKSGLELAERLEKAVRRPAVICVTGYREYAIGALRHQAFDYLLKPVNNEELDAALHRFVQKGLANLPPSENTAPIHTPHKKIRFNIRSGAIFIDPEEIIYCRADGNYTHIVIAKTKIELVSHNLKYVENLLAGSGMKRLGRSLLYNPSFLSCVDNIRHELRFEKGTDTLIVNISPRNAGLI
jgi:two-component system, LytTR family, response regulator